VIQKVIEKANNSVYMLASVRRSSVIFFLSLFLTYAGVASAFETCLRHDGHSDHATSKHRFDPQALVSHDESQDPSIPVIHCTSVTQRLGPAARMASAEIFRSDKSVALHMVSLPDTVSAVLRKDLWLEAVFKRIVAVSLPIDFARHLFLSVLRI
jgi:hypothetical protein